MRESLMSTRSDTGSRSTSVAAASFALLLGLFLVFGAGIAQPALLHNAVHDARHAFAFPCH